MRSLIRYGGFKKYVEEADRRGLVFIGDSKVLGREWIKLVE